MSEQVDAVVIGMGPGGEEVAGSLALAGLRWRGSSRSCPAASAGSSCAASGGWRTLGRLTGTAPAVPPIPALRQVPYWTNREAMDVEAAPAPLAALRDRPFHHLSHQEKEAMTV
jgi:pyruvate/2-oxoglutarate dehydrogenase complex dihydrolipoamide dehydrogenase (E3) component